MDRRVSAPAGERFADPQAHEPISEDIDPAGRERGYRFQSFPRGHRGFEVTMTHFSEHSANERDAICAAWLRSASEQLGPSTRLLRIYHLTWLLSDRRGDRAAPPDRTLAWICSEKGARAD